MRATIPYEQERYAVFPKKQHIERIGITPSDTEFAAKATTYIIL